MREIIKEKVYDLLSDIIDDDSVEITEESNIVRDLELSSIELSRVVAELESEYDFRVSNTTLRKMTTVAGIIDIVTEYASKR